MVPELKDLETSQLVDLLAHYTSDYYDLVNIGAKEKECLKLMSIIETVQEEIISRKLSAQNLHSLLVPPEYTL